MKSNTRLIIFLSFYLVFATFLASTPPSIADDHKEGRKHNEKHDGKKADKDFGGIFGRGHDDGNETTGQIVAWSLAAANLPVLISLAIRAIRRFVPLRQEVKNSIWKFNTLQKKYSMQFHYILNPLILIVALLHWMLSKCKSTALPEWGLLTMCLIVMLGIILKFKLCPKTLLRNVHKIHTQPIMAIILVSMLLIGHLSMD